jgi:tetratricopeptide (TPR) repeat protein
LPAKDGTTNLTSAIACYKAALRVYSEHESPQDWAAVQNNLGNVYLELVTGDREANLTNAIACYEAALRVYSEQHTPLDWARVERNLGNSWLELTAGDRAANLDKAIACYTAALRVYTEQEFPDYRAFVERHLQQAWLDLDSQPGVKRDFPTNDADGHHLQKTETTETTPIPSAGAYSTDSNETILNGVKFVKTSGQGPISWHYPGFGKPKKDS